MTRQDRVLAGGGEMGARMRARDWSQTTLGPFEDWPPALYTALGVLLASPSPVALFWGPDLVMFHNDGAIPIYAAKHPACLGVPAREVFPEIWDVLAPMFHEVLDGGRTVSQESQPYFMNRRGFPEEAYFTFAYVPVRDEQGEVAGVFDFVTETTRQTLSERRFQCLRELSRSSAPARDLRDVLRTAAEVLARQGPDVPFALLYQVDGARARLTLCTGLTPGTDLTPEALALDASPWPLAEVLRTGEPRLVEDVGEATREVRAGPWPEPVRRALLLPLCLGGDSQPDAVFAVGLSPRLPLDESYRDFLQLLARQLAAQVEEARLARIRAERELLLQERETARRRMSDLVENAPALMCTLRGPDHVIEMANPLYRQLNGVDERILGQPLVQALPVSREQGFVLLLDEVYRTGTPFTGNELPFRVDRTGAGPEDCFFNCIFQPRRDTRGQVEGIDVFGFEVTGQVRARRREEALSARLRESEERLRRVVEAAGVGLWELDGTTGHVEADARTSELLGLPRDAASDLESGLETVHPEDREPLLHAVTEALAGKHTGHPLQVFRVGGWQGRPERWVESRAQRLLGADGQRALLAGAMLDVTERKQAEAQQARQSRWHALRARVGVSLSEHTTVRAMLQDCVQALVEELELACARVWLVHPTRATLELEAHAGEAPEPGPEGLLERIAETRAPHLEASSARAGYPLLVGDKLVGVVRVDAPPALAPDTFEGLKQVANSLAQGVERLRAEDELKRRVDFEQKLIGIASHDLRNPLSAISLGTTLLTRRDQLDERTLKSVLRIQSSAERATRMVEDLLDFTQARLGGGIRIEPRPADLHELTRGVLDEVEAAWPTRALEVRHEGEGRGDWDADRLAQVVQNLVTNALKYSPEGSRVRVVTRTDADLAFLSVHNTGTPIPPPKLASIFEPMQRATAEVDKTGRSVGLGLYIVRSIVTAHGGDITVTSSEAEGTVFTVRMPRQRPRG